MTKRVNFTVRISYIAKKTGPRILGMLDDFLGVLYREADDMRAELLRRSRKAAMAFDQEWIKMGIAKQGKDS